MAMITIPHAVPAQLYQDLGTMPGGVEESRAQAGNIHKFVTYFKKETVEGRFSQ